MRNRTARPIHVSPAAAVIATTAALLVLLPVGTAQAHDAISASDPAPDSVITEPLETIRLTFSAEPLEGVPSIIEVRDPSGALATTGDTITSADTVSRPLELTIDGVYQVVWQTVSVDGHTISGDYTFSVDLPEAAPTPTMSVPPMPDASADVEPSASTDLSETVPPSAPDVSGLLIGLTVGALLILSVATLLICVARRRNRP